MFSAHLVYADHWYMFKLNQNYCSLLVPSELPPTEFEELPTVNLASQVIWHLHWQFFLNILLVWTCWGWLTADPLESLVVVGWEIWVLWMDRQSTKEKKQLMLSVAIKEKIVHRSEPHWCFSSLIIKAITLKIQFSFSVAGKETLLPTAKCQGSCSMHVQLHSLAQLSWW